MKKNSPKSPEKILVSKDIEALLASNDVFDLNGANAYQFVSDAKKLFKLGDKIETYVPGKNGLWSLSHPSTFGFFNTNEDGVIIDFEGYVNILFYAGEPQFSFLKKLGNDSCIGLYVSTGKTYSPYGSREMKVYLKKDALKR